MTHTDETEDIRRIRSFQDGQEEKKKKTMMYKKYERRRNSDDLVSSWQTFGGGHDKKDAEVSAHPSEMQCGDHGESRSDRIEHKTKSAWYVA